jgi:BspA type Leucine rich repeat region (6 copies)
VNIPDTVERIGDSAFLCCGGLKSVTIGNSVTNIGSYAFDFCTNLTSVTIPQSVVAIGPGAFFSTSLRSIYFKGNTPTIDLVFGFAVAGTVYYLPSATGWDPRVHIQDAAVRTNWFGFYITGTAGLGYTLETCTNLTTPVWSLYRNITLVTDPFYFSDPHWRSYPSQFYRLSNPTFGYRPIAVWQP